MIDRDIVLIIIVLIVIMFFVIRAEAKRKEIAAMHLIEKQKYFDDKEASRRRYLDDFEVLELTSRYGNINSAMICPHCQEKGKIRTKLVMRKKGISGSKATAAVLTGGISVLATGLSRKDQVTEAYCGNCECKWEF